MQCVQEYLGLQCIFGYWSLVTGWELPLMLQAAKLHSAMALGCDGLCITLKSTPERDITLLASSVIPANSDSEMEQASKHASTPPSFPELLFHLQ